MLPLVSATFMATGIALLVAVPLGLGIAMFLSEYASQRVRKVVKPILEMLAGIPTVVYGFLALTCDHAGAADLPAASRTHLQPSCPPASSWDS